MTKNQDDKQMKTTNDNDKWRRWMKMTNEDLPCTFPWVILVTSSSLSSSLMTFCFLLPYCYDCRLHLQLTWHLHPFPLLFLYLQPLSVKSTTYQYNHQLTTKFASNISCIWYRYQDLCLSPVLYSTYAFQEQVKLSRGPPDKNGFTCLLTWNPLCVQSIIESTFIQHLKCWCRGTFLKSVTTWNAFWNIASLFMSLMHQKPLSWQSV